MIEYEEKEVKQMKKTVKSITCDICGTSYGPDDTFETQEFHFINFTGGYGSVFGDDSTIKCDICQYCLKKLIEGKYRKEGLSVNDWKCRPINKNLKKG